MVISSLRLLCVLSISPHPQDPAPLAAVQLAPPVRLMAEGEAIDVTVGHAAPLVMDFDGDGLNDLLVGEFGSGSFPSERLPEDLRGEQAAGYALGRLRIYPNRGSASAPEYRDFDYLRAGKEFASIPTT